MKIRLLSLPLLLMLVASLAACGGGSSQVPANAVATVAGTPITLAEFNAFFAQASAQAAAQTGAKPTPGTPQYASLRSNVVAELVEITEVEKQAPSEGVSVTHADASKFISNLVKTNYGGSMKKFTAALAAQGLTLKAAQEVVYINLLTTKIHTKVTASAKVTQAQERAYYTQNLASYQTPAQTTRSVQYILFKCAPQGSTTCTPAKSRAEKKLADKVEQKLQGGASFTAMAKQYSDDPTTAPTGGKFNLVKGGVVPAFGDAGFALKTGAISQPVDATSVADQGYGWFIIKALAPTKSTPAHTQTFTEAEPSIHQTLLGQAQDKLWQAWLAALTKQFQGKVSYAPSYTPPATTALAPGVTTG